MKKISPQNIFPLVDTSPPIAFLFHYGENISPKAVIAASVAIDHKGAEITSQNHLIARDRAFVCSTIHKIWEIFVEPKKIEFEESALSFLSEEIVNMTRLQFVWDGFQFDLFSCFKTRSVQDDINVK